MARLNENELANYISVQLSEILPRFVDGIVGDDLSSIVHAVREFEGDLGKLMARAIVRSLDNTDQ